MILTLKLIKDKIMTTTITRGGTYKIYKAINISRISAHADSLAQARKINNNLNHFSGMTKNVTAKFLTLKDNVHVRKVGDCYIMPVPGNINLLVDPSCNKSLKRYSNMFIESIVGDLAVKHIVTFITKLVRNTIFQMVRERFSLSYARDSIWANTGPVLVSFMLTFDEIAEIKRTVNRNVNKLNITKGP